MLCKLKFNYVVACQVYGQMKKTQDSKADDIEFLLAKYPNLRVAYIDTIRMNKSGDLLYFSVLVKHDAGTAPLFKKVIRLRYPILFHSCVLSVTFYHASFSGSQSKKSSESSCQATRCWERESRRTRTMQSSSLAADIYRR